MKVKALIKKLQKFDPEAEVMINELACSIVRKLDNVYDGLYIDDGFDAPEIIDGKEDPNDYDIDLPHKKVVCLE